MQSIRRKARSGAIAALSTAAIIILAGCASTPAPAAKDTGSSDSEAVELLGGQERYDELMSLYDEAIDAGETKVVIYTPQSQLIEHLQDAWSEHFPEIQLEAVQMFGPTLVERIRAEASTGQGTGDIAELGQSQVPGNDELFAELEIMGAEEISDDWKGPKGITAGTIIPFVLAYNPENVDKSDLPTSWDDLLEPEWKDRLAILDPSANVMFTMLSTFLHWGIWDEDDVQKLADQNPLILPPTDQNGGITAVAQGERDATFWTSVTQTRIAMDSGAPLDFVFPFEENNIGSGLYVSHLVNSPNPLAAELFANWRFTEAAANSAAEFGFYSLVEGADSPEGLPTMSADDFTRPVPIDDVIAAHDVAQEIVRDAFTK